MVTNATPSLISNRRVSYFMGSIVAWDCGLRNADCGISGWARSRVRVWTLAHPFRNPQSAIRNPQWLIPHSALGSCSMSVQAIACGPPGAVPLAGQPALPEDHLA